MRILIDDSKQTLSYEVAEIDPTKIIELSALSKVFGIRLIDIPEEHMHNAITHYGEEIEIKTSFIICNSTDLKKYTKYIKRIRSDLMKMFECEALYSI